MNWGMLPFQMEDDAEMFDVGDYIYVPGIRTRLKENDLTGIDAYVLGEQSRKITLTIAPMTPEEREIVLNGCLINFNRNRNK